MLARQPHLNFFSFIRLEDQSAHRDYNIWHQLDHLPENRALPGVIWGDRWKLTDELRPLAKGTLKDIDYVGQYWFDSPSNKAVEDWTQLGEDSFQWGRGPIIPGVKRDMLAFFKPVKGYTTPEAFVSAEVLPMRPHTGVHIMATKFYESHSLKTHDAHMREDRDVIPALLKEEGILGAWTFSYLSSQRHTSLPFDETPAEPQGIIRMRVTFIEGDLAEANKKIESIEQSIDSPDAGELLLSATLKTIIPWQDW